MVPRSLSEPRIQQRPSRRAYALSAALLVAGAVSVSACSGADEHPAFAEASAAAFAGTSSATAKGGAPAMGGGSGLNLGSGGRGGAANSSACAAVEQRASNVYRPIDVIFVIDNSRSMDDEISAVQARINGDFADIIAKSGLDYRVIMVSRYGKVGSAVGDSDNPICISAPLGSGDCRDPLRSKLSNTQRFFHYSADVESHNAWCVLLGAFKAADEYGDTPRAGWVPLAPKGYAQYLRPAAFKAFVVISDDDVSCTSGGSRFDDGVSVGGGERAAAAFDAALLNLSPANFGSATQRNYVWHSIVGLAAAAGQQPWAPSAPVQLGRCAGGSEGPGTGYQALSRLTGGLRYPSCEHQSFDAVFNTIAHGIVQRAELSCEWDIPSPPAGQSFDKGLVNVRFTPSAGAPAESIPNVASAASCGARGGWYYDDPALPNKVVACPSTCSHIKQSSDARIDVLFGCRTETLVR